MAFSSSAVSVGTTATKLLTAAAGDMDVWLMPSTSATYYIGGSSVTSSNGLALSADEIFHAEVRPGDELWAVVGSGTLTVRVLTRSA